MIVKHKLPLYNFARFSVYNVTINLRNSEVILPFFCKMVIFFNQLVSVFKRLFASQLAAKLTTLNLNKNLNVLIKIIFEAVI